MALWHRTAASLPSGIDDELLSGATEERLRALELTHAFEIDEVRKDSPVEEQLVTLVRDATRIAVEARGDAIAKIALGRRLLGALAEEGHFRVGEFDLRERLLRGISERTPEPRDSDEHGGSESASIPLETVGTGNAPMEPLHVGASHTTPDLLT